MLARLSFFAAGLLLQLHLEDVDEVVHVLLLLLDRLLQRLEVCPDELDLALVVLQRLCAGLMVRGQGEVGWCKDRCELTMEEATKAAEEVRV